jgi:hypothetical protein
LDTDPESGNTGTKISDAAPVAITVVGAAVMTSVVVTSVTSPPVTEAVGAAGKAGVGSEVGPTFTQATRANKTKNGNTLLSMTEG